jgi:hypothetical protein
MEKWNEIRHRALVEGASKRSIRRDYGIGQAALDKILALTEPPGYAGSEVTVRRYVASHKRTSAETFVPLSQPPGEAQFDFGEGTVEIEGIRMKAVLAVMTLPYSDAFFVSAYPRECTETFQAGHVAAFEYFGGVPRRPRMTTPRSQSRRSSDRTNARSPESSSAWRATICSRTASVASLEATRRVTSRTSSDTDVGTSWSRCRRSRRSLS